MRWPHERADPSDIRVFRIVCTGIVIAPFCWPGLTFVDRSLTAVIGLYALTSGFLLYGLGLFLIRALTPVHRMVSFGVFYAGLIGLVACLGFFVYAVADRRSMEGVGWAREFALNVPTNLGVLAAGFTAFQRGRIQPRSGD
jgi:hypothetical protein